jgi:hypothetical protein
MHMRKRKSRIVCFRLPQEEYEQFREMCIDHSVRSISELARTALCRLRDNDGRLGTQRPVFDGPRAAKAIRAGTIPVQISELQQRLRALVEDIDALARQVDGGHEVQVGKGAAS